MLTHLRKDWVRLLVAGLCLGVFVAILVRAGAGGQARAALHSALPAVVALFALTAALSLALLGNAVFGLRDKALEQARRVRDLAWQIHDEFAESKTPAVRSLVASHIDPLLTLNLTEYPETVKYSGWSKRLKRFLSAVPESPERDRLVARHLLVLEDEVNLLGLLFIPRIIARLHVEVLTRAFLVVVLGVLVILLGSLLPHGAVADLVAAGAAWLVCIFAALELLVVLSYVRQESSQEAATPEE